MALGLPIAVTVGWSLAAPAKHPAAIGVPGGEGALGSAPKPEQTTPMTPVRYSPRPGRPAPVTASSSVTPAAVPTATVTAVPSATTAAVPTSAPPPVVSSEPELPPLDQPPVPTPTEITSIPIPPIESGDPSAIPSESTPTP
ncbi:hypothetical protein AB0J83_32645 [Actinoplanes sp. NPDC049596]|uniref:hypothetical protein n=1 Tax=unclassified Actinoplanes TaxID=2626549 RepID=UPI00342B2097